MITYIKMKKAEWKVKYLLYTTLDNALSNPENLTALVRSIYDSLSGSIHHTQEEIITTITKLIYENDLK